MFHTIDIYKDIKQYLLISDLFLYLNTNRTKYGKQIGRAHV